MKIVRCRGGKEVFVRLRWFFLSCRVPECQTWEILKRFTNVVNFESRISLMKQFLALFSCLMIPGLAFADSGYKVMYDGGSIQGVKAGKKVKLYIDPDQVRIVDGKTEIAKIPASSITEISYGQDVHRRIGAAIGIGVVTLGVGALMALTKSKKHFVGLTWATGCA
jgi:hypothetical protein